MTDGVDAPIWKYTTLLRIEPGLETVIEAVPAVATLAAGTEALRWAWSTNVVVRGEPLKLTVAPETKPVPLMVRLKALLLGATEVGVRG